VEISQILGLVLISVGFASAIYDVFTGKVQNLWLITLLEGCLVIGIFLFLEIKEAIVFFILVILILMIVFWVGYLYAKLNEKNIEIFNGVSGRASGAVLAGILFVIFRYLLYPTTVLFLNYLKVFINIPKLVSVVITLCVVYTLTIFLFGLLYASLYHYLKNTGFHSVHHLKLQDFFFFSAFNIVAKGYKDMMPDHWLISLLCLAQIFIGIALLGIYLAGAFTFIITP